MGKRASSSLGLGAPGGGTFTSSMATAASSALRRRTSTQPDPSPPIHSRTRPDPPPAAARPPAAVGSAATSAYPDSRRGSMAAALAAAATDDDLQAAVEAQLRDQYALTSQASRSSCLRTWILFHGAVHASDPNPPPPFPLTPDSILKVSSLFKARRYMSFQNYMYRAKSEHLSLAYRCRRLVA